MKLAKAFAASSLFLLLAASGLHVACSTASVAGRFGFTTTGSIPAVGPVAATGIFAQDASGNITGAQTRSLNGSVADETFTGTATVNSDCTGTDTVQVFQDGSLVRTTTLHVVPCDFHFACAAQWCQPREHHHYRGEKTIFEGSRLKQMSVNLLRHAAEGPP